VNKNNIQIIEKALKKQKIVAMLAPSFVTDFEYPLILQQLREFGFDKVVELTFGAKMVNKQYHKILKNPKKLFISSVCPGIVETIKKEFPEYKKNLVPVISPMIATAKMCKKIYPKHKTCFISPCSFKKIEAEQSKDVDYALDYRQLKELFTQRGIKNNLVTKDSNGFDRFYNEYTRIYPVSGGLLQTAHIKGVLHVNSSKVIDGWGEISKFLKNPDKNIKFLDITFCKGGCIGGPFTNQKLSVEEKKKKVLAYLELSKSLTIPKENKGVFNKVKGLRLKKVY